MLGTILERADVREFLNEVLTDTRFTNTRPPFLEDTELFVKNQYGLLFVIDAFIKFSIIVNDIDLIDEYVTQLRRIMKKFNESNDLSLGVNKLLSQIVASKLDLEDVKEEENKQKILEYIYDKYIRNGYFYHSVPGNYIKEIKETGIDSSEAFYNLESVKRVNKIFANHGLEKVFGKALDDTNYVIDITDSPLMAYYYSLNVPKYFASFCSTNIYMDDKKFDRGAFYRKDKVSSLDNVKKLCAMAGLTDEERDNVIEFFETEWTLYKFTTVEPYIMFIKRSVVKRNVLNSYKSILDNCAKEDIGYSIAKIIDSKYTDIKINSKLFEDDYKLVKFIGYKTIYFEEEEGYEEIFNDFEEEKKEDIQPINNINLVPANNYGKASVIAVFGTLMVVVGLILMLVFGIYK